jgi:PhnB protein
MPERPLSEQLDQAIDGLLAGTTPSGSPDQTLSALTRIASRLRDMPDDGFKTRLSRELQEEFNRRPPMTVSTRIEEPTADEFAAIHTVTPFICVPDGDKLIEFMKHTFGAEETNRHPHHPGGFVANVRIGDSDLLIMGGESLRGQESLAALHVYVKDCDATYRRALDAGAVTGSAGVGEPADRPYGERAAFVSDPFGNYWFIATRLAGNYVGVGLRHVTPSLLPSKAAPLIEFMKRAFGAEVEGPIHEEAGHMLHAFVRLGEAMVEMAEAQEEGLRPFAFYMHTDDVDAVYHRALAAGATSLLPPADQPFGDRLAIVVDPAGNRWFAAKRLSEVR